MIGQERRLTMAKTKNPNTSYPSRSHTSEKHPERHIDEDHHGPDGKKESSTHGIEAPEEIMDEIDKEHDQGKSK